MLNEGQSKRISELEAEVRSLHQQLTEAKEIIKMQNRQIHPANSREPQAASQPDFKKDELQGTQITAATVGQNEINLQDIAQQLHDFVCENKAARLDRHLQSKTLLHVSPSAVAINEIEEDIKTIIETVGWAKGILIANWNKSLFTKETIPRFAIMLPVFFRVLGAWRSSKHNLTYEKTLQLQDLKYNHYAYKLFFEEILPKLAKSDKRSVVCEIAQTKEANKDKITRMHEEKQKIIGREIALKELIAQRQEQRQRELDRQKALKWMRVYKELKAKMENHAPALLRNYRNSYKENEYGAVVDDKRGAEIFRFITSVKLFNFEEYEAYYAQKASRLVQRWCEIQFRKLKETDAAPDNGHDFEHWVAAKLEQAGWKASVTQASGDDGVDVIAGRDGLSVAVQCKRFKGSVGNKAVQEVYSGMKHMQLDRAVVISTGQYTKAAKNLARTTGVLLLSEHDISHLWDLLQK